MQAYRIGASSREKRKLKELQEHFLPLIAPYEERIAALETKLTALENLFAPPESAGIGETDGQSPAKRGPGRPPKN